MIWVVLLLLLVLGCNSEVDEERAVALEAQLIRYLLRSIRWGGKYMC
jgi:hypothetical protein